MKRASLVVIAFAVAGCGSSAPVTAPTIAPPNPHMAVPPVSVAAPAAGAVIGPRFSVSGSTSGRAVTIELVRSGRMLQKRTVRATSRGTFAARMRAAPGALTVEARASGAEVDVPVTVSR
jgi:hypothetical protein